MTRVSIARMPMPESVEDGKHQQLRASEERFRAFVTATSDVVYCMSSDWSEMRYLVGKDFISDTHGPSRAWLTRYIHPDDRHQVLAAIEQAIRHKSVFELEHRVIRADGALGWTFSRAIPLLDADGEIVEWFGTARDVSERKHREEALHEADRRKDEFIAVLAHELRNPLAPIANAVQLLRLRGGDAPIRDEVRSIIERQLASLTRLVDDLLDVSRIASGRLQLRTERVSLATLIERAVETARPSIARRKHALHVSVPPRPIDIHADPVRLQQVLVNLLNNAAKYTDDGGRIDLVADTDGDELVVKVRDTGIGIAPEMLPQLFQTFTQAHGSVDRSQGGLGLGLYLVKRLVEMHGGSVHVETTVGRGSEFIVRIPAVQAGG